MKIIVKEVQETFAKISVENGDGKEIFRAEVFDFQNGGGDIDIFSSNNMRVLEWIEGVQTLTHESKPRHIAVDFSKG